MLHCSFSPLWRQVFFFVVVVFRFRKLAKLLSCSALTRVSLVILQDGAYNVVSKMSSGMCNQESFSLPKVCQCNAQSKKMPKKRSVRQLSKMWLEFQEAALVTTWGADHMIFLNSWLTSGLSLVTSKISFKLSIHVTPVAYVAPAANLCLPVTDSSLQRRRTLET